MFGPEGPFQFITRGTGTSLIPRPGASLIKNIPSPSEASKILDSLFKGGPRLDNIGKAVGGVGARLPKGNLPGLLFSGAAMAAPGIIDARRYLKSLGDYGAESLRRTGNQLTQEEARRIIRDFNSLYKKSHPTSIPRAITNYGTRKPVKSRPQSTLETPPTSLPTAQPQTLMPAPNVPGFGNNMDIELPDIYKAAGIDINAGDDVGYNTVPGSNLPLPVGQQAAGSTPNSNVLTRDQIIEMVRKRQEDLANLYQPYIQELETAQSNLGKNRRQDYYRDLGLAAVAGLSRNNAYERMIGQYSDKDMSKERIKLAQNLLESKLATQFDPNVIYGDIALAERMGLPIETALADKDKLKTYANMYNYGLDYDAALRRINMIADSAEKERAFEKWKHDNPRYNTLDAQSKMWSSLMSNAVYIPELQQLFTHPEVVESMIKTLGLDPSFLVKQAEQQAGSGGQQNTKPLNPKVNNIPILPPSAVPGLPPARR